MSDYNSDFTEAKYQEVQNKRDIEENKKNLTVSNDINLLATKVTLLDESSLFKFNPIVDNFRKIILTRNNNILKMF